MSVNALSERSGGVIGTIGPIGGKGVWSLKERGLLAQDFYDDVSLLLHCNGANGSTTFLDSSKNSLAITRNGDAQISTAQSKFGGASLYLDGTGDYLDCAQTESLAFGTGSFTAEFWVYFNSGSGGVVIHGTTSNAATFGVELSSSANTCFAFVVGGSAVTWTNINRVNEVWQHHAFVRSGSTLTWYRNGISQGGRSFSQNVTATGQLRIGANDSGGSAVNGYIDDLRITKGVARYTGSFTPPQRQFRP